MTTVPKVYAAICAVMHDIGQTGISKDRKNQQQGYSFRGIDDVYNELNGLLSKHKLVMLPSIVSRDQIERQSAKGGSLFYTTVTIDFKLVSAEDGSSDTIRTVGEAMDSADKSSNKAQSAAYKYAAMMVFCIPTEGDNDADVHTPIVAPKPVAAKTEDARKIYQDLVADLRRCEIPADCDAWWKDSECQMLRAKLPLDWLENLKGDFKTHKQSLITKVADDEHRLGGD